MEVNGTQEFQEWQRVESILQTSSLVTKIVSPLQLALATFGNLATIAIFCRMKEPPSLSEYFCALAVSDLLFLYFALGLYQWCPIQFGFYFFLLHDVTCKLNTFFIYVCGATSSWLLVAMTIQRAVCVVWPHQGNLYCTMNTSRFVVCAIFLIIGSLYSHLFYGVTLLPTTNSSTSLYLSCSFSPKEYYEFFQKTWVLADAIISSFVPFVCLAISNTVLFRTVLVSVRIARRELAGGQSTTVSIRKKKAESLTVTLIVLSFTFLLLTAPQRVFYMFWAVAFDLTRPLDVALCLAMARYFNMLYHFNSVLTFYLYCLSGSKFRAQAVDLLCGAFRTRTTTNGYNSSKSSHVTSVSRA